MDSHSELTKSNNYSLSIRFNSDGFSLMVYDQNQQLLSSKSVSVSLLTFSEQDILQLLRNDPEMQLTFDTVRIIYESDKYTFVPIPLFKHPEAGSLYHFQYEVDKNEQVKYNVLKPWDVVNVFALPRNLLAALTTFFPHVEPEHHLSFFLAEKVKQRTETVIYVWLRKSVLDIVLLENANIKLINSFQYQTNEDVAYSILRLFDQFALDTDKCAVRLYNANGSTEIKKLLQKFIKQCDNIND